MGEQDSLTATEGGPEAYLKELKREEKEALAPLRRELKSLSDPVRKQEIRRLIREIKHGFAGRRKSARRSLFSNAQSEIRRSRRSGNTPQDRLP